MKTDCNGRFVYLDPRLGASIAVAESARNVVCTGAKPVAVTNCLNFGNPYKPEVYWQFEEAIAGMSDSCRVLETPVTGGNVSFYNESETYQVYPTPVIGMIGIIEDLSHITPSSFQNEGDFVYLVGQTFPEIGGSEFLKKEFDVVIGLPPKIDLETEKNSQNAVLEAIRAGLVHSCHDIADGGLAVALAECCILNSKKTFGIKAIVESDLPEHLLFFSESQSRFIISTSGDNKQKLVDLFQKNKIMITPLGEVGGAEFSLNEKIVTGVDDLIDMYYQTLPKIMDQ